MPQTAQTLASGMTANHEQIKVRTSNIANKESVGFQSSYVMLVDNPYETKRAPGSVTSEAGDQLPTGFQIGSGSRAVATYRTESPLEQVQTGNTYDLYINGPGYFEVQMPDGTPGYTKNGIFGLNAQRQLVDLEGRLLVPNITIPENAKSVTISEAGKVSVTVDGQIDPVDAGTIGLVTFNNPGALEAKGGGIYLDVSPSASGGAITGNPGDPGLGTLIQKSHAGSNVNTIFEMTGVMINQQAYEMCLHLLKSDAQMHRNETSLVNG